MRLAIPLSFAVTLGLSTSLDAQSIWVQAGATSPGEYAEFEMGIRAATGNRHGIGVDASLDTYLRPLVIPAFVGVMDVSLAAELRPVPPVAIIGRAGGTGLLFASRGGAVLFSGYQGGVGVAVTADSRTTVRLDYTYRRLRVDGRFHALPSLTFGFLAHR